MSPFVFLLHETLKTWKTKFKIFFDYFNEIFIIFKIVLANLNFKLIIFE